MPLVEQDAGDREAGRAGAEDDHVVERRSPRAMIRLHSRAASGEPMTMMRSPGRIDSSPRGTSIRSPRMMLATFESAGTLRLLERQADDLASASASRGALRRHVELDDLHLAVGEDVGLLGRGNADRARDRMRRLELGGDHEVDLDLPLVPGLEVLGVRGADDRLRVGELLRERRGDEVDLVSRRAGDHERRLVDPRVLEDATGRPVPSHGADVVPIRDGLESRRVEVDDRDLVVRVQRLDDGRPDLAGSEDDDLHDVRRLVPDQVGAELHSGSSSMPHGLGDPVHVVEVGDDLDRVVDGGVAPALATEQVGVLPAHRRRSAVSLIAKSTERPHVRREVGLPVVVLRVLGQLVWGALGTEVVRVRVQSVMALVGGRDDHRAGARARPARAPRART